MTTSLLPPVESGVPVLRQQIASQNFFFDDVSKACKVYVEIYEDRLELPMRFNFQRSTSVSLSQIHSLVFLRRRFFEVLIVGSMRSTPVCIRSGDLTNPAALELLSAELLRYVSKQPGGASMLHRIDRRSLFFERLLKFPWFSVGLVALFGLIHWFVSNRVDSHGLEGQLRYGAFVAGLVASGEVFRLVAANFLHIDLSHLLQNSMVCLVLGWIVEASIGPRRLALMLFLSGVAGYSAVLLLNLSCEESQVFISMGSSAAVWGLGGAYAFLSLRRRNDFPVGFRSPWPFWILLVSQVYAQGLLSDQVVMAHLVGGLTGLIFLIGAARGSRRVPLPKNSKLTPAVVIVAGIAMLAAGLAIRNNGLSGTRPYIILIHDRLALPNISDEARHYYSWVLATSASAPKRSLQLALDKMEDLLAGDPGFPLQETLATLYYRVGIPQRAVSITRALWRTAPTPRLGSQLTRFYQSAIDAEEHVAGDPDFEPEAIAETRIELSAPEYGGGLQFETILPHSISEPVVVHGLMYRDGELDGLIEIMLETDMVIRQCLFPETKRESRQHSETIVRAVWLGRIEPGALGDATICRLQRMLPEFKHLP
ncbi:MAG: rhomboid family intramembrane serine protease [Myxococcales bacterium]|nr:rhomboid family intramembrane serine protease [Myxococcales bacterium]